MRDARQWWRIALLAIVVLAAHLWFLAGMPRIVVPPRETPSWVARTVTPPAPSLPAAPAPAKPPESPAVRPPAKAVAKTEPVAPAPAAAPPVVPRVATPAAPAVVASAAASAEAPPTSTTSTNSTTHAAGAARAARLSVPPSAHFNYEVVAYLKGITLNGNARLDWRNDGREYEAQLTLSAPLLRSRTQRSTGLITPQGLAPLRFSDKYRSEEAAHFDRENGKVVFSTNKPEATLEAGVQDRLSIVLQLGAMIAGEPSRYPAGTYITVQTASTKEAEPWTFSVVGHEMLELPGGRVRALRLARNPRKEFDVKVELWLAPGAAYAPVRLRLTQPNGDWVDQLWSSTDRA